MSDRLPTQESRSPGPPAPQQKGPNLGLIAVPAAIAALGKIAESFHAGTIPHLLGYHLTETGTAALFVALLAAFGLVIFPPRVWLPRRPWTAGARVRHAFAAALRALLRGSAAPLGVLVRLRSTHLDQDGAREEFSSWRRLPHHARLLGLTVSDFARAAGCSRLVAWYFLTHPDVIPRPELMSGFARAAILPLSYLRGQRDYGNDHVMRRLLHFADRGMTAGWTQMKITETDNETRRELLASIERQQWKELRRIRRRG